LDVLLLLDSVLLDSVDDQVLGVVTGVVLLSVVQTEELVVGVDFDSVVFLLSVDQTEVVGVVFDSVFLVVVSTQTLLVDEEEAPQPAEEDEVLTSLVLVVDGVEEAPQPAEEVVLTSLVLELLSDAQGRATAKLPIVSTMCIATPIKSNTWRQAMQQLQLEC
jgi:hypothetical protein